MTEEGTVHKRHDGKYEVVTPVYSHQAGEPTMTDLVDELGFEAFQLDEEERNYQLSGGAHSAGVYRDAYRGGEES
jgi:hypothetical protein